MQIKKHILLYLRFFSLRLYKAIQTPVITGSVETNIQPIPYRSLSPIDDAKVDDYVKALKWALDNRKEKAIYNIALTGPYGSGKSSILKTFMKENNNKDYVFLEISLATFKEELPDTETPPPLGTELAKPGKGNDEILRLIELSILQQIFYHEEDEKIPDSRFKKIKTLNRKSLYYITAGLLAAVLFGFYLFFASAFEKLLLIKIGEPLNKILHGISLLGFCLALITAVYRSVRILYGLKISKIKFQETEIEIDKGISKSILNNHLDEILYFFEVTPYSVVIIEDLDRFRQAEIFTKLRELNLLINNSKKIKGKQVVFIYAVRDEMFQNKDRTKFFDFIIPVIPVINSSNSKEKLTAIAKENNYEISEALIDDVSLFIDDMRLLYNITNEYAIYSALLDQKLDRDKLMAILIYKNIWPDDFVLLGNNDGKLYKLLNKRNEYIKENLSKIDAKIKEYREEIGVLQQTMLRNADELRLLYVARFAANVGSISTLEINGTSYSLSEAASEETFEYFKKGKFKYYTYYYYSNPYYMRQENDANLTFTTLEAQIDQNYTYQQRLLAIKNVFNSKEQRLKEDIENLEKQKPIIRHARIKEILSKETRNTESTDKKDLLVNLLLRNGYINEDYQDYISLFYEGSLTKNDRTFVLNVKSQASSDYDIPLNKIANIIKKFRPIEFDNEYLLNFSMLDYMLSNPGYDQHLNFLFQQLNIESGIGLEFIDGYISSGAEIAGFIKRLVHHWQGIMDYVDVISDFSQEKKDAYFMLVIEHADLNDLKGPILKAQVTDRIAKQKDFLTALAPSRIKALIDDLVPKFESVKLEGVPAALIDQIITGNHYQINLTMTKAILSTEEDFDLTVFEERNYAAINSTGYSAVIEYVHDNINEYITEVYLKLSKNIHEEEEDLLFLLNNTDIATTSRIEIIGRCEMVLSNLKEVDEIELDVHLFEKGRIKVSWENVILYFLRHGGIDELLTGYLNQNVIAQELGGLTIPTSSTIIDLETTKVFMLKLLNSSQINDENYELLIKAVPYEYDISDVVGIGRIKMSALICNMQIAFNQENLESIRTTYPGLQHRYIELFAPDFIAQVDALTLQADEVGNILRSDVFEDNQKQIVIDHAGEQLITSNQDIIKSLIPLVITENPLTVSKNILIHLLQLDQAIAKRVKLFNMYYKSFGPDDTVSIFKIFPKPYNKIGEKFTSPVIEEATQEDGFLAYNLKEREMISNFKVDGRKIKIINFKWK